MPYAVLNGRRPGIYSSWESCAEQVNNYPGAVYREFSSKTKAKNFLYDRVIIAYVDGSCNNNGRHNASAGYAVLFENPRLRYLNESAPLQDFKQTNNRAELTAIIRAIQLAPNDHRELVILSDSQYSMNTVAQWIWKWRSNGWRTAKGKMVANADLIRQLDDELHSRAVRPVLRYVPAHAGEPGNEIADQRARQAALRNAW